MLDHVDFGTTDYEKSREFYVACLAPLDIHLVMEIERQDYYKKITLIRTGQDLLKKKLYGINIEKNQSKEPVKNTSPQYIA